MWSPSQGWDEDEREEAAIVAAPADSRKKKVALRESCFYQSEQTPSKTVWFFVTKGGLQEKNFQED